MSSSIYDRKRAVVVTGMGVVSALGPDLATFQRGLFAGACGVDLIRSFDASRFRTRIGAEAAAVDFSAYLPIKDQRQLDRLSLLAIAAADQALGQAGIELENEREGLGLLVGTAMGPSASIEDTIRRVAGEARLRPTTILKIMLSSPAAALCERYQCRALSQVHVTACAASAHALAQAAEQIRVGSLDLCLVVGCDSFPSEALFAAWDALVILSADNERPKEAARPFAADRCGLVIGEGAAALVLESRERAEARGVMPLAELAGSGCTSHTPSPTLPSVDGMAAAMALALRSAGAAPTECAYVNAHGTATELNDSLETAALHRVFGDHAKSLKISSTKAAHGHTMGASGAIEAVATVLALAEGIAPPTLNLKQPDVACDLDYTPLVAQAFAGDLALSNSFAFGGHYVSLAFRRIAARQSGSELRGFTPAR